jgi:nucleoside transporter
MPKLKTRLSLMMFLQYAVWGAYLLSLGAYLSSIGFGEKIGWFFAAQGVVSLFMPAFVGIVADRWMMPKRVYALCHIISALCMMVVGINGFNETPSFASLFLPYCISTIFFMPTIALSNSICFSLLQCNGIDTVSEFPKIRMWGTIGFIIAMWVVNFAEIQTSAYQFILRSSLGLLFSLYIFTLPKTELLHRMEGKSVMSLMGYSAFHLFKNRRLAVFFIFAMAYGVCLQITNGFVTPYLESFAVQGEYAQSFVVKNSLFLTSLSQISEAFCILLLPFCIKKWGIKPVIVLAAIAWMFRYIFLGVGNPANGVAFWILSMLVYGIAFNFFNIAGSMFVDSETEPERRSCAQGMFMMMTNGFGTFFGMILAQKVVNMFTESEFVGNRYYTLGNWSMVWMIFSIFALLIALLFALSFKEKNRSSEDGK